MSKRRRSSWSRRSLVDAALENPSAVDVAEKSLDVGGGTPLLARVEPGDGREHAEELRPTRRQLRRERARLRQMGAIAAIVALTDVIDRNALWRACVRRIDQPGEIEIIGHWEEGRAR